MKTHEEIKKGLEKCSGYRSVCDGCEFANDNPQKWQKLMGYALAYIQQLESRLAQVERERDVAVSDMRKAVKTNAVCIACKHDKPFDNNCKENNFDCANCKSPCMCQSCHLGSNYEWRGVCAENPKEES